MEIATKPHLAKSENCQHVEIVVKFSAGALRARVEIARKPTLRRTNSKYFPLARGTLSLIFRACGGLEVVSALYRHAR